MIGEFVKIFKRKKARMDVKARVHLFLKGFMRINLHVPTYPMEFFSICICIYTVTIG